MASPVTTDDAPRRLALQWEAVARCRAAWGPGDRSSRDQNVIFLRNFLEISLGIFL